LFPSDEFEYRNFFYSLQEKTVYSRFFYRIKLFPHEVIQKHWASMDYKKNLSIIGKVQKRGGKEIIAIGSYTQGTANRAEVAFVVREDYQNLGIGSYLLKILEKIAKENQYAGFSASVLPENKAMQKFFLLHYPDATVFDVNENEIKFLINFENPPDELESDKECKWKKLIF
jgi:GNAT superfamily N-acetyltransferase